MALASSKGSFVPQFNNYLPWFRIWREIEENKFLKDINSLIFNNFKDGSISENLKSS